MNNLIPWEECLDCHVRQVEVDESRINSLIDSAKKRFKMTKSMDTNFPGFIVEQYYEVIKELLVAFMLKGGYKSKNHQCLFTYFYMMNPSLEYYIIIIKKMSYLRNRSQYYGEEIPSGFYDGKKDDIIEIIGNLLKPI